MRCEAFSIAFGNGYEHGDDPAWDAAEADALYTLLEQQIGPEFYERNEAGVPARWVARIRESMARLTPEYSANRVVRQYTEVHYIPAAGAYKARAEQEGKLGDEVLGWQQKLAAHWDRVAFGTLLADSKNGERHFEVPVYLGELDPGTIRVELFANGSYGQAPTN